METPTNPIQHSIVVTDNALREIRNSFQSEQINVNNMFIRIGAKPGGCSGYKYTMELTELEAISDADSIFESDGIRLVVDTVCMDEVMGSVEIDFKNDDLVDQGFVFRQLQATGQCGCGQSFAPVSQTGGSSNNPLKTS